MIAVAGDHALPRKRRAAAGGDGPADQLPPDAAMLVLRVDRGVEQHRVSAAVPADVDEADELLVRERLDPSQSVPLEALLPEDGSV